MAVVAAGIDQTLETLEANCAALARRGQFIREQGVAEWPDGTVATQYHFIHALYQDVLYDRIPVGRRVRLHQQIGARQEACCGVQAQEIAAELAMHFVRGRDAQRAVQYCQAAARNVSQRSAYPEAISQLHRALEMLAMWPETSERFQRELEVQLSLGPALTMAKGYADPGVEQAYSRALELSQQTEVTPYTFRSLSGLWGFYHMRGCLRTAYELANRLHHFAQSQDDPFSRMTTSISLGATLFFLGQGTSALMYLEQGMKLYDPSRARSRENFYAVIARSYTAIALWLQGYPDQSLRRGQEALSLAQQVSHPHSIALALCTLAVVHSIRGEWQAAQAQAETAIALALEKGVPYWVASGRIMLGAARAVQGQGEEGIAQLRQGLETWQAMGTSANKPYFFTLLAIAFGKIGQASQGLKVLEEALTLSEQTGERWWDAELHRLRGSLLLAPAVDNHTEAVVAFQQALSIARDQQTKSLELRATISLSRLWQQQGKRDEAREQLASVYNWFSEGFDTADLQEAKALLDELRS